MDLPKTYRIETERLVIRCYQPEDAEKMHAAITGSVEHLRPWVPFARENPREMEWMISTIRRFRGQFDLGQDAVYAIFDRNETEQLGGTGLHNRIGKDAREIGYWIDVNHINRGYATEAVTALIRIAFEVEELSRLEIRCDPANQPSRRIPQRLGFRHEQTLKNHFTDMYGKPVDTMVWALLKREYEAAGRSTMALRAFDFAGRPIPF
jgi:RimJ/RimL family protein N-acetyltransferase